MLIETDGSSPIRIDSNTLQNELRPLLNETGQARLEQAVFGRSFVGPADLQSIGIDITFDQSQLLLVIQAIPGDLRQLRSLGAYGSERTADTLPVIDPARVSSYLNANVNLDYATSEGLRRPDLFLEGATRVGDVVVEYDGAFTEQFSDSYRFYRRGVRAVYDQAERYRRFSAGDLRVNTLPLLRTPFIGGVAVERRRRLFDPYLPVARLGGREIFLDNSSTVEVLLNGERYQTFQLDAGRYDLANLPVQLGNNDVQLLIRDSGGREQVISLNFFYEPLELPPGEVEYVLAAGYLADTLDFEPDYTDRLAITGMYRRAFGTSMILGGAAQVSELTQAASIAATMVPQIIPGTIDLEVAASTGEFGTGYAARGNYRFQTGGSFATATSFNLNIDYESKNFRTLADIIPVSFDLLSIGANITKGFDEDTYANAGAIYSRISGRSDRSTVFIDVIHRLSDRLRGTVGVEYGTGSIFGSNFGVRLGVSLALGGPIRGTVDYRSRSETLRANLSRGVDDYVGSIGWDLGFVDSLGQTSVDGSVTYVGNRFDARATLLSSGGSLGAVGDQQRARLQFGTSLAFADGAFGIGRPIRDSFALLHAHPALRGTQIISGRNLSDNRFDAKSGEFGAAVQGDLASYNRQDVQFDTTASAIGADIGDGTARIDPPYRAGYKIEVGSAYYVSATGFLLQGGAPVALGTGTVNAVGDEEFVPQPFFTNSAGRFSLLGLAPGGEYQVTLRENGARFTIRVPANGEALLRLGRVDLTAEKE
ncbi:fimbria/pilus outer membrane usher protein [Qipengyuania sp. JC766]|uniref:fimbria/pilus outer membrane usher protein n=1 Tax=Qipengyuania sp. JC766 TaxID=3232139 RepID=UPI003458FE47